MREELLRKFLEKINTDEAYKERLLRDPHAALDEIGLSLEEKRAMGTMEPDALERLAHQSLSGGSGAVAKTTVICWITRHLCTWAFCGPPGTRDWQCPRQP